MRRLVLLAPFLLAPVGLAPLVFGCTGDLDPAYRLERVRVLAVQTTVEGTPSRATPMPGEAAVARWLVVDANGAEVPVSWRMRVCVDDACAVPIAEGEGNGSPELPFVAPADASEALHVEGVACAEGAPPVSPLDPCDGASVLPEIVEATVRVAPTADEWNDNPDPAAFELTIDGRAWTEEVPDCSLTTAEPVVVASEDAVAITFAVDDAEREPAVPFVLSHLVTEGDLDGHFAVLDPDDPGESMALPWTPSLDEEGWRAVTHLFVARDGLGGVAWVRRVVCVR